MIVVYRKYDNRVCGNSGSGPVIDPDYEIANAVLNFGGQPKDYGVIEVEILPKHFIVENGEIVEQPPPTPETYPNPDDELAAAIEAATTLQDLKDALLGRARQGKAAGKRV